MTDQEWAAFVAELAASFKGDFGPTGPDDAQGAAQEAAYRRHVGGYPYAVGVAAVALLVEGGQVFMPAPGELAAAVNRVAGRGSVPFAEVLRGFQRAVMSARRRVGLHRDDGEAWRLIEADVLHRLAERCGEGPARWVAARGVRELWSEDMEGEHAGAVRHRLEQEYSGFAARADEDGRVARALQRSGGLRRVEGGRALGLPEATS